MLNALTIDVEEYFHAHAYERVIDRASWDRLPARVVANTRRVLYSYFAWPPFPCIESPSGVRVSERRSDALQVKLALWRSETSAAATRLCSRPNSVSVTSAPMY